MLQEYSHLAFLDIETTGRDPGSHEIIEVGIAMVDPKTRELKDTHELKIMPEHLEIADPESLAINHFTPEAWQGALPQQEAMQKLCGILSGSTPCGWNVGFDRAFLETALNRAGFTISGCGIDYTWHDIKMDFIRWAKLVGREEEFGPRFGLRVAREAFGVSAEGAHSALPDAMATFEVWKRLEDDFQRIKPTLHI
ncbi:MAG: hypothetical protein A2806_00280 [Candidatus Terrybacteria bacterium RIFCSPHIGHO2_01_FULL_48_17]|uniref:Exonuclease domain-containing protein n=1 Tax=Candidatus Terrybacteria bacterium RIFCSPHIGHO2_01_FULL_48_17 TaxID=1802362 RepID=A0A1G2PJY4_9BACT|nr:MAG: hypothetical protein A2806_00280 [Candidatus Terrybacteria bacterium RIFCSPHIGHO2_01_FULL_48_17]